MVRSFRLARRNLTRRVEEAPPLLMLEPAPMVEAPLGFAPLNPNPSSLPCGVPSPTVAGPSAAHLPTSDANPIYIGNVPLRPPKLVTALEMKFADAFNNSTRQTLRFIPPERQNGEIVVRPTINMVHAGSRKWGTTAVGYFLGKKPPYHQVPVWIKMRHLPVEYWTIDGLSTVASGIGWPLYPDAITKACTRLDFARVCVMLDYQSTLPKHIVVMSPREDGSETPCRVDVEYEWIPSKCTQCCSLGHSTAVCPANRKPSKPPVKVYVPKSVVVPPIPTREEETEVAVEPTRVKEPEALSPTTAKGKAIIVYNPFSALSNFDDEDVTFLGGPNASNPTLVPP
ncbi:UNVERIFIED_CONTAM: hypothetical protein Slati_3459900 [Sesamum latifolium]|uniref:DUF4283 domain-containing protein n=1 Tax=Sesamum latifolium TaxID=2727402 RepID=A0AAW2UJ83_9LAMI